MRWENFPGTKTGWKTRMKERRSLGHDMIDQPMHHAPWEHITNNFRGYNPIFWGQKLSLFMVWGPMASSDWGSSLQNFHTKLALWHWEWSFKNDGWQNDGNLQTFSQKKSPVVKLRRFTRWTPWKIFDSNFDFQKGNGFWNWIKGILENSWDGSKKMEYGFLGWFKHFEVVGELVRSILFESFDLQKSTA